jgi:hypothetical protein
MTTVRVGRAWLVSVATCVAVLAIWSVAMQAMTGRWGHLWNNMLNVTVAFGGLFAIVAAVLYVPAFFALGRIVRPPLTPGHGAAIGVLLAPVMLMVLGVTFRDSAESVGGAIVGLLQFWSRQPAEFVLGLIPYAIAGAVFGFIGAAPTRVRTKSAAR